MDRGPRRRSDPRPSSLARGFGSRRGPSRRAIRQRRGCVQAAGKTCRDALPTASPTDPARRRYSPGPPEDTEDRTAPKPLAKFALAAPRRSSLQGTWHRGQPWRRPAACLTIGQSVTSLSMKLFHRTANAAAILREGFRDATGRYLTTSTGPCSTRTMRPDDSGRSPTAWVGSRSIRTTARIGCSRSRIRSASSI